MLNFLTLIAILWKYINNILLSPVCFMVFALVNYSVRIVAREKTWLLRSLGIDQFYGCDCNVMMVYVCSASAQVQ